MRNSSFVDGFPWKTPGFVHLKTKNNGGFRLILFFFILDWRRESGRNEMVAVQLLGTVVCAKKGNDDKTWPKCCMSRVGTNNNLEMLFDPLNQEPCSSGWRYTYPSEKYESQLGWLFPIYIWKIKMFQTTNQPWIGFICCIEWLRCQRMTAWFSNFPLTVTHSVQASQKTDIGQTTINTVNTFKLPTKP